MWPRACCSVPTASPSVTRLQWPVGRLLCTGPEEMQPTRTPQSPCCSAVLGHNPSPLHSSSSPKPGVSLMPCTLPRRGFSLLAPGCHLSHPHPAHLPHILSQQTFYLCLLLVIHHPSLVKLTPSSLITVISCCSQALCVSHFFNL